MAPRDIDVDALNAYEGAEERRQGLIEAWETEGRPLIAVGHAGQPVPPRKPHRGILDMSISIYWNETVELCPSTGN